VNLRVDYLHGVPPQSFSVWEDHAGPAHQDASTLASRRARAAHAVRSWNEGR
jgi:hypothetical protein